MRFIQYSNFTEGKEKAILTKNRHFCHITGVGVAASLFLEEERARIVHEMIKQLALKISGSKRTV